VEDPNRARRIFRVLQSSAVHGRDKSARTPRICRQMQARRAFRDKFGRSILICRILQLNRAATGRLGFVARTRS
jgi:hypothetical protein